MLILLDFIHKNTLRGENLCQIIHIFFTGRQLSPPRIQHCIFPHSIPSAGQSCVFQPFHHGASVFSSSMFSFFTVFMSSLLNVSISLFSITSGICTGDSRHFMAKGGDGVKGYGAHYAPYVLCPVERIEYADDNVLGGVKLIV